MKKLLNIFNISNLSDKKLQKLSDGIEKTIKNENKPDEIKTDETEDELDKGTIDALTRYLKETGQLDD